MKRPISFICTLSDPKSTRHPRTGAALLRPRAAYAKDDLAIVQVLKGEHGFSLRSAHPAARGKRGSEFTSLDQILIGGGIIVDPGAVVVWLCDSAGCLIGVVVVHRDSLAGRVSPA